MNTIFQKVLEFASNLAGRAIASLGIFGVSLGKINWSNPSWDVFIALLFVLAVFLYGITLGKGRIMVMISAIYMSAAVTIFFPQNLIENVLKNVPQNIPIQLEIFILTLVILFFFLVRSGLASIFRATTEGSWIETFIFSFFQIGLVFAIAMSFFPPENIQSNLPATGQIFTNPIARFAWIILPIIGIIFTKKRKSYRKREDVLDI